jgi:hypothetical protein
MVRRGPGGAEDRDRGAELGQRSTRHGSACTQSDGPRESSSRWSVVLPSTWSRRWMTGPFCLDLTIR